MKWFFIFLTCLSVATATNVNKFIAASNRFAITIYREVAKSAQSDFLFSPFSAELALALAHSGARGITAEQLATALHLKASRQVIESSIKDTLTLLRGYKDWLNIAVKMYVAKNYTIKPEFRQNARDFFFSEVENTDFNDSNIVNDMNRWVEQETRNKIQNMVKQDSIDDATVSVIINALYFEQNWYQPFKRLDTSSEDFYLNEKNITSVKTMKASNMFNYSESAILDAKFLQLPFRNKEAVMVIALPNGREGLASLEKNLKKVFLNQNFTKDFVKVQMPLFKTESEHDLKILLKDLGVTSAFDHSANFSGISNVRFHIDNALQKTFINVNEDGVKAAAATGIYLSARFGDFDIKTAKNFIADHPFLYFIKIKEVIVFVGRVVAPSL